MITPPRSRCAIYTRKSSEEGLEMDFNSLDAQHEACTAYITSQKHEGWQPVKTRYDDGGYSGGNMQRPALKQLLDDIAAGLIDIIVVYKVDRLSRSLHDFARMVEVFDKHKVSFVSVTQQFNTTTSMGRLTLNVLLSFAQFEREVTGERIRDKITASKKKGMWMGGPEPLGYKIKERKLIISPAEAQIVNHIYQSYLKLGCVRLLEEQLDSENLRSKIRINKNGISTGGMSMSRGSLYKTLSNPLYIGQVRHKEIIYQGQHQGIIPQELWDQVQELLSNNAIGNKKPSRKTEPSPLNGKLFDEFGERLTSVHANKKGRRYRYYVSQNLITGVRRKAKNGWRLPGQEIEKIAAHAAAQILNDDIAITTALQSSQVPPHQIPAVLHDSRKISTNSSELINKFVERIELRLASMRISLTLAPLTNLKEPLVITQDIPLQIKRRGVEMRLIINNSSPANTDTALIKTIAKAHVWLQELLTGEVKSFAEIAARENIDKGTLSRIINLAFLSPTIIENIINGQQNAHITSEHLLKRVNLDLDWEVQKYSLDF